MKKTIKGCNAWASYLEDKQLPVLKETLSRILSITDSDRATVARLAKAVLEDADLSTSVLKLANSALFNPSHTPISTVSRAIMVIGFNSVKSMTVTSLLVDRIAKGKQRDNLFRCLAKSLHSAMQAKYLSQDLPAHIQEEIFVAALLSNMGEVAFWSSDHELAEQLTQHPQLLASDPHQTQREFLGTTFRAITRVIAKGWNLGHLLEESLSSPKSKESRIVATACDIANLFDQSMQLNISVDVDKASLKLCSEFRQEKPSTVNKSLKENRRAAIKLAETLGIEQVGQYLKETPANPINICDPDPSIQIECLQKITLLYDRRFDETIVDTVLEFLHKGIGFERAAVFLSRTLNQTTNSSQPNRQFQLFKSLGTGQNQWFNGRIFSSARRMPLNEVFIYESDEGIQNVEQALDAPFGNHKTPSLAALMPISNGYQALIYADRCHFEKIAEAHKSAFELLVYTLYARMTLNSSNLTSHRETC